MPYIRSIVTFLVMSIVNGTAHADIAPLLNLNPAVDGSFVEPANNKTWGYAFYVTTPIRVTHLGWYDTGGDGLSHSHRIGICKDTGGVTLVNWPAIASPI